MGDLIQFLNHKTNYPCVEANANNWYCFGSDKKEKEKWKQQQKSWQCQTFLFMLLLCLRFQLVSGKPGGGGRGDGIVVTQSDFQALREFKRELVD